MKNLNINGKSYPLDVDLETPLLWFIRDSLGLTGSKYGCGKGLCGACTVHFDGSANLGSLLPIQANEPMTVHADVQMHARERKHGVAAGTGPGHANVT